jgi:hypothetical protein
MTLELTKEEMTLLLKALEHYASEEHSLVRRTKGDKSVIMNDIRISEELIEKLKKVFE